MASNTSGGVYKYNYTVEPSSALQCLICLDIAEDPWQHNKCGRLLCKECLEKYGRDKPCPNCRKEQPQYFDDNKSKSCIQKMVAFRVLPRSYGEEGMQLVQTAKF